MARQGRRRARGVRVCSAGAAPWAPLRVPERSVCVWAAPASRAPRGVSCAGARLRPLRHPRHRNQEPPGPVGAAPRRAGSRR